MALQAVIKCTDLTALEAQSLFAVNPKTGTCQWKNSINCTLIHLARCKDLIVHKILIRLTDSNRLQIRLELYRSAYLEKTSRHARGV